jgi:hypothetical protein
MNQLRGCHDIVTTALRSAQVPYIPEEDEGVSPNFDDDPR